MQSIMLRTMYNYDAEHNAQDLSFLSDVCFNCLNPFCMCKALSTWNAIVDD
jgi:hypothetical protein